MTDIIQADRAGIARAAALLRAGDLVAFGTETVYGLGADATNARAVASVFEAKGRPRFNPLICHYQDADAAFGRVIANQNARALATAFWPGPLTMVLRRAERCDVALLTGAGLDTLAVRVPAHPLALALLVSVGRGVAAPSANRSGRVSPTTASHVLAELDGRIAAILECGPSRIGIESTVLDLTAAPVLLRPGGVTTEAIEALIGPLGRVAADSPIRSPGMGQSHYAPSLPLRLAAETVDANEALLAFGPHPPGAGAIFVLSETGDLAEAAAALFGGLRWLDAEGRRLGLSRIAVMRVPRSGLGLAINDRLARAAAGR